MMQKTIRKELKHIAKHERGIRQAVAQEVLDYHNPKDFFSDLLQHGCQSGMIGSLIYYCDTHQFYDKHYAEIEDLREEMEECLGQPLQITGDLKNWMAWFGFEETARKMADELSIEW